MERRRAPQRPGHRTTLRVPDAVLEEARALAGELGTTTNDALVRLAEQGAAARRRRRVAERLARERRAAVGRAGYEDAMSFPSPEALRTAMLGGRDGESS